MSAKQMYDCFWEAVEDEPLKHKSMRLLINMSPRFMFYLSQTFVSGYLVLQN